MPGQFPNAKTPHKDAPNNWNAVVTGMARDEPTNSNAFKCNDLSESPTST